MCLFSPLGLSTVKINRLFIDRWFSPRLCNLQLLNWCPWKKRRELSVKIISHYKWLTFRIANLCPIIKVSDWWRVRLDWTLLSVREFSNILYFWFLCLFWKIDLSLNLHLATIETPLKCKLNSLLRDNQSPRSQHHHNTLEI